MVAIYRMLTGIPDDARMAQIKSLTGSEPDINIVFIEQGVYAPYMTINTELTLDQELLLDLMLTGYLYDDRP